MSAQPLTGILYAGAGDIAKRCYQQLKHLAVPQWALRRNPNPAETDIPAIQADLTQADSLQQLPACSHVLYTATPSERSEAGYAAVYETGLNNLLNALDLAALQRFVFVSSTAVYGASESWIDERSPTDPAQFNGIALVKAEQLLRERLGDKLVVIRFSGIYGPERLQWLQRLRKPGWVVPSSPGNWANRIHIDDVVQACSLLLQHPHPEALYVGTDDTPLEQIDLYTSLAEYLGITPPQRDDQAPAQGKRFSNQRLKQLGWTPKWPDTLAGYQAILSAL